MRPGVERFSTVAALRVALEVWIGLSLIKQGCEVSREFTSKEVRVSRLLSETRAQRGTKRGFIAWPMSGREIVAASAGQREATDGGQSFKQR